MRIAVPMRRRVLALTLFAVALAALLPLRAVIGLLPLDAAGIGARDIRGPIWAGRIRGLVWRGAPIGDVDARIEGLPLLIGRVRLSLRGDGIAGALIATAGDAGVEDVSGVLPLDGVLTGVPITGLSADSLSVRFGDGRCRRAGGRVTATIAGLPGVRIAQGLTGTARCDGAALLLPLRGPSGLERLDLRFAGDGTWRARLELAGGDAAGLVLERHGRL